MRKKSDAKVVLTLEDKWQQTDKVFITERVEQYLPLKYPECAERYEARAESLMKIAGVGYHTACAWLNRSRTNVKIPLLKLCMIAENLGVDVNTFLD